MRKLFVLALLLAWAASMGGCATQNGVVVNEDFRSVTYKTLASAKVTYDGTMRIMADLKKKGSLTDAQWKQIVDAGRKFVAGYNLAADAFAIYETMRTADQEAKITIALSSLAPLVADFVRLTTPMVPVTKL